MSPCARRAVWIARRARHVRADWGALRKALLSALRDHGVFGAFSVAVVGDPEMAELHERFLGLRGPTDVLAFPLAPEGAGETSACAAAKPPPSEMVVGEVVVSADTAAREAARRSVPLEKELALYAIHGVLHLVGYDDRTAAERRRMRRMERKYLEVWSRFASRCRGPSERSPRSGARGAKRSRRSRSERKAAARDLLFDERVETGYLMIEGRGPVAGVRPETGNRHWAPGAVGKG